MFGALLLLLSFSALSSQTTPEVYENVDAYEIYSTILQREWPSSLAHAKRLVIRSETATYEMCLRPDAQWEDTVGSAISDYLRLNEKPWVLQPKFSIDRPYEFLKPAEFKATMEQGGWEGFYRQYRESGGLIEFSAVGLNRDKTVAVAYMAHHCGWLCGGGAFHVLEKKDGKWKDMHWKGSSCSWAS